MAGNKIYFILKNNKKEGAFTFDELTKLEIFDNTLIWKAGWDDWKKAEDVPELKEFVIYSPPPTPQEKKSQQITQYKDEVIYFLKANALKIIVTTIIFGLVLDLFVYKSAISQINSRNPIHYKYPIYLTQEERENPILIFWEMLPSSLVLAGVFSIVGFGIANWLKRKKNKKG